MDAELLLADGVPWTRGMRLYSAEMGNEVHAYWREADLEIIDGVPHLSLARFKSGNVAPLALFASSPECGRRRRREYLERELRKLEVQADVLRKEIACLTP